MFSQPPPLRISFTSMSSRSHCSKCRMGVPAPRLLPLFSPVIESTELGRSLPLLVAAATAAFTCSLSQIWFTPTGVLISKVGMPVSWQMAPSISAAWSMFWPMMASAWAARVPSSSLAVACFMAARTSGGRSVDVLTIRATIESKKAGSISSQFRRT